MSGFDQVILTKVAMISQDQLPKRLRIMNCVTKRHKRNKRINVPKKRRQVSHTSEYRPSVTRLREMSVIPASHLCELPKRSVIKV
jgi:hypothetical protein